MHIAHLHSKLEEGLVSVAAFQPQVSDIISSLRRVEYSCQQDGRDQIWGSWSAHICMNSKLEEWIESVAAFQPGVFDIIIKVFLPARGSR